MAFGPSAQESEASGVAVFAKPGRMRWTYEKPQPSVVVSDGKTLWLYDPSAREVQEYPVGEGFLSGTAVQFLLGEGRILEAFEVRAEGCGQAPVRLLLEPHEASSYERLELVVVPETGDIRGTAVVDLFGNRTEVTFESLHTNRGPDAAQFTFRAEPGVRVLRPTQPARTGPSE